MHYMMFNSIPDLHPLDASITPAVITVKNVPKHFQVPPPKEWGAKLPLVETVVLEDQ